MPRSTTSRDGATDLSQTFVNPLGEEIKKDGGGYAGLVDKNVPVGKNLIGHIPPGNLKSETQAEQYSNPRGWPGLAGMQFNRKQGDRLLNESGDRKVEKSRHMSRTGTPD